MKTFRTSPRAAPFIYLAFLLFLAGCSQKQEDSFFKQADAHFERGRFNEAVQVYQDYLSRFPDGAFRDRALFRKGEILYFALDKKGSAVQVFSQLVEKHTTSEYSFRAHELLALIYRDETRDYLRAIVEYQWLLKRRPSDSKAHQYQFQVAHGYFLANRLEQSIREFQVLMEKYPDSNLIEQAYDELGSAYLILGQPEKAMAAFKALIEKYPESSLRSTAEFKLGNCYEEMGSLNKALAQYRSARNIYDNRRAVDIRIRGVEDRLKVKQGLTIKKE